MLQQGESPPWAALAQEQYGAVTRQQLIAVGVSPDRVRWLVSSGRFQLLHLGVFAAFTGPVPWRTRLAGAVLRAGPDAAVGGRTALHLHGVLERPPEELELCIPFGQRRGRGVGPRSGLVVSCRRGLERMVRVTPWPPRLRVEQAVLDVAGGCAEEHLVVSLVLDAVRRRRTTVTRLRTALELRSRHRWRGLLGEVLQEAGEGVHSMLERRYLHGVERAHGLPRAVRQYRAETSGGTRYWDLRYPEQAVVIELDGVAAHPLHAKQRDDARGRGIVMAGDVPLVYGWDDVVGHRCRTAAEVATVLTARGWRGTPTPCNPACAVRRGS